MSISIISWTNVRIDDYNKNKEKIQHTKQIIKFLPINQQTRGEKSSYIRVGSLHEVSPTDISNPVILPVYGARTYPKSTKWQYYTFTDQYNKVKLPIYNNKQKNCQNEYGCEELDSGDVITIYAYSNNFKFEKYIVNTPKYIPYI